MPIESELGIALLFYAFVFMIFFFVLLLSFIAGCFVAGVSLHDPDTCWQLALGKLIFETGAIVRSDPFSYTFNATQAGHGFVMYQWLSNLIFYATYKTGGIFALLCLTAEVLSLAFIVLPICRAYFLGKLSWLSYVSVLLATLAASFHFLARPEIWSYLFMSMYLAISFDVAALNKSTISRKHVLAIFLLMVLWCNLHSGFVLGIVLLLVQAICIAISLPKSAPNQAAPTVFTCLAASIMASLVNPYGVNLWRYLPDLFFPNFNKHIVELQPLTISELATPTFLPYIALAVLGIFALAQSMKTDKRAIGVFPVALFVLSVAAGIFCRRLIPFSAIIECMTIIQFFASTKPIKSTVNFLVYTMLMILSVVAGVYWTSTRDTIKIAIPQRSAAFHPPMKALDYLQSNLPAGNLLNDPQFGNVMILHMNPAPKVFIDTRFDMYGSKLVDEYYRLAKCENDFANKLNERNIGWVFMRPQEKLVAQLRQDPHWKVVFEDDHSVILVRQ
ncbi:MAG: hypothetical protein K2Y22_05835 [Candidatus Obscuribacterales bacterium]|nr:hypothetical protein [Candidatus Obscuribacterales bacterium]